MKCQQKLNITKTKIVSLSLGAPGAPACKERIDEAKHGWNLVYYQEGGQGFQGKPGQEEELGKLGMPLQDLGEVEEKEGELEELGALL